MKQTINRAIIESLKIILEAAVSSMDLQEKNQELKRKLMYCEQECKILREANREINKTTPHLGNRDITRSPKRQPITSEIYKLIMTEYKNNNYCSIRLRILFFLLLISGCRIHELLPLKIKHLKKIFEYKIKKYAEEQKIYNVFLTNEGITLLNERKEDFDLFFQIKEPNAYIFSSESNHYRRLSREAITREVNEALRVISNKLSYKPYITSYSFRTGYISKLWKNTKNIEFVIKSIKYNPNKLLINISHPASITRFDNQRFVILSTPEEENKVISVYKKQKYAEDSFVLAFKLSAREFFDLSEYGKIPRKIIPYSPICNIKYGLYKKFLNEQNLITRKDLNKKMPFKHSDLKQGEKLLLNKIN